MRFVERFVERFVVLLHLMTDSGHHVKPPESQIDGQPGVTALGLRLIVAPGYCFVLKNAVPVCAEICFVLRTFHLGVRDPADSNSNQLLVSEEISIPRICLNAVRVYLTYGSQPAVSSGSCRDLSWLDVAALPICCPASCPLGGYWGVAWGNQATA